MNLQPELLIKKWTHLGDELSVRNSNGQLRRYDLVFKKPDGTIVGVEVNLIQQPRRKPKGYLMKE